MENHSTFHPRENLAKDLTALKRDFAQVTFDLKETAYFEVEAAKQRAKEKLQLAKAAVAARPFTVLAVGFVLGFIVGLGSRRKK